MNEFADIWLTIGLVAAWHCPNSPQKVQLMRMQGALAAACSELKKAYVKIEELEAKICDLDAEALDYWYERDLND